MIRTRFAPSPTGLLHVGGLRTALYNYLFAKSQGGEFLLRIEDTDRERFVEGAIKDIIDSLHWAGISPDEGVVGYQDNKIIQNGEFGPYVQSERLPIYKKYAEELISRGEAYYCFCSAERLEKIRDEQQKEKKPTGYDQFCLKNVELVEAKKRAEEGEKHVIRLKMPKSGETRFTDLIRGEVVFKNNLIDDQVLIKSDGFPTYHLAVVVDDHLMKITHVVRGEEWISSTPKHLQLFKYFGWHAPVYAHLPLLLNSDKSKLSKRQGDVSVGEYIKKGYLADALINFVAFLGWNPGDNREIFKLDDLTKEFNFNKVNKTGAVFNLEKLEWFNKEYLKKLSVSELWDLAQSWLTSEQKQSRAMGEAALSLEKDRIHILSELAAAINFVFKLPDFKNELLVWKKGNIEEVKTVLTGLVNALEIISDKNWNKVEIETVVMNYIKTAGLSNGSVLWPMRVALSGQENSPGPFEIAGVLGKPETIRRLNESIKRL